MVDRPENYTWQGEEGNEKRQLTGQEPGITMVCRSSSLITILQA